MQPSRKFLFDVGITFIASVISMLLGSIISVLLARHLGAGDLGLYRMASTIYGIAVLFASFGIPAAMIKYVAECGGEKTKANSIISSGVITSLIFGIGFSILFYLSTGIFERIFNMQGLSGLLRLYSPVFIFTLVSGAMLGMFNGYREMKKYSKVTIVQSLLMLAISLPLIYLGFGVAGIISGVVLSSAGSCLYLLWLGRDYFEFTLEDYIPTTKKMLRFGAQILGANALSTINYQAATLLIGYFLTAAEVGYYGVAVTLSTFLWLVPSAIQTVTYPATSEYLAKNNHASLQMMIDKSMKYTACILFPIGLGVWFFSRDIIMKIFGSGFIFSILPLQIMIAGTVIFGLNKATGGSVSGAGRPDLIMKITGISAIINIILNVVLIPYFGITGAAIATFVSYLIDTVLTLILTIKILKIKFDLRWYIKLFGVTFLTFLFFINLDSINHYLFGTIILCFYVFTIIALLLTKDDKDFFKNIIAFSISTFKEKILIFSASRLSSFHSIFW